MKTCFVPSASCLAPDFSEWQLVLTLNLSLRDRMPSIALCREHSSFSLTLTPGLPQLLSSKLLTVLCHDARAVLPTLSLVLPCSRGTWSATLPFRSASTCSSYPWPTPFLRGFDLITPALQPHGDPIPSAPPPALLCTSGWYTGTPTHGLNGCSPNRAQSEVYQRFSPKPSMSTSYTLKLHSRSLVPCHFQPLLMLGDRALVMFLHRSA